MGQQIDFLLQSAELSIVEFDIHIRTEMKTFNRRLSCYVMSYIKKGEAKLRVGKDEYMLLPGTVVIIPPYIEHDHYKETEEETIFLWCHFTYEIGNALDVLKIFNLPITFKLTNSEEFEKVFLEYKNISFTEDFLIKTILKKAKSHEILYLLLKSIMNSHEESFERNHSQGFISILTQIVTNPEKELSLQELSNQFHLHPTYISNRFKELFGKSPMHVQREMKIDRARKLLISTEMSITEIAHAVGYPAIPGFTRLFKNYVGISPTQFRNLNKKWSDSPPVNI
ncbi:helix-turn-helix domain-containing protein [Bacillaceae bacterium C204]|uniref:helix-turn-helix transcriptional regulator n=1 Tax=Neobacillus sp. 204 TaxID=3383351 RepID=UPI0039781E51